MSLKINQIRQTVLASERHFYNDPNLDFCRNKSNFFLIPNRIFRCFLEIFAVYFVYILKILIKYCKYLSRS